MWKGVYKCVECESENEAPLGHSNICEICGSAEDPNVIAYRCPECEALNDKPAKQATIKVCEVCGFNEDSAEHKEETPEEELARLKSQAAGLHATVADLLVARDKNKQILRQERREKKDALKRLEATERIRGELEIKLSAAQQSVAESKETADKALVDRLVMEKERATLEKSIADLQSAAARADKDAKEYQEWLEGDLATFQARIGDVEKQREELRETVSTLRQSLDDATFVKQQAQQQVQGLNAEVTSQQKHAEESARQLVSASEKMQACLSMQDQVLRSVGQEVVPVPAVSAGGGGREEGGAKEVGGQAEAVLRRMEACKAALEGKSAQVAADERVVQLQAEAEALRGELGAGKAKVEGLLAELQVAKEAHEAALGEAAQMQGREGQDAEEYQAWIENDLNVLQDKVSQLGKRNVRLEEKGAALKAEVAAAKGSLSSAAKALRLLEGMYERLPVKVEGAQGEYETLLAGTAEGLRAAVKGMEGALEKARVQVSGLQEELRGKETELARKVTELKAKETELKAKEAELKAKEAELKGKETERAALDKAVKARETELKAKETELKAKETELKGKEAERAALDKALKEGKAGQQQQQQQQDGGVGGGLGEALTAVASLAGLPLPAPPPPPPEDPPVRRKPAQQKEVQRLGAAASGIKSRAAAAPASSPAAATASPAAGASAGTPDPATGDTPKESKGSATSASAVRVVMLVALALLALVGLGAIGLGLAECGGESTCLGSLRVCSGEAPAPQSAGGWSKRALGGGGEEGVKAQLKEARKELGEAKAALKEVEAAAGEKARKGERERERLQGEVGSCQQETATRNTQLSEAKAGAVACKAALADAKAHNNACSAQLAAADRAAAARSSHLKLQASPTAKVSGGGKEAASGSARRAGWFGRSREERVPANRVPGAEEEQAAAPARARVWASFV